MGGTCPTPGIWKKKWRHMLPSCKIPQFFARAFGARYRYPIFQSRTSQNTQKCSNTSSASQKWSIFCTARRKLVNFLKWWWFCPLWKNFCGRLCLKGGWIVNQLPVSLEFQNDDVIWSRTKYTKIFSCAFDGSIKNWKWVTKKLLKRVSIFSHKIKNDFSHDKCKIWRFFYFFRPKLSIFCARWQKIFCEFLTFCSQMRAPKTRSYK